MAKHFSKISPVTILQKTAVWLPRKIYLFFLSNKTFFAFHFLDCILSLILYRSKVKNKTDLELLSTGCFKAKNCVQWLQCCTPCFCKKLLHVPICQLLRCKKLSSQLCTKCRCLANFSSEQTPMRREIQCCL